MLLSHLEKLMSAWRPAFAQARTFQRMMVVVIGLMCCEGRRTITGSLALRGLTQADWSADYRIFSKVRWERREIFRPVLAEVLPLVSPDGFIPVCLDDTLLKKSSQVIAEARWLRDPLSPKFRTNLIKGLRFVHSAIVLPHAGEGVPGRAISVAFELAPPLKKPGKRATPEERDAFKTRQKAANLSTSGARVISLIRQEVDGIGMGHRKVLAVVDGGYTNNLFIRSLPENTDMLGRTRKDIALYRPAEENKHGRLYGERLPTPDQIRQDETVPYVETTCFVGSYTRTIRYKEVKDVLWKSGARARKLRLFTVAPLGYTKPGRRKRYYRDPAYLITTDLVSPAQALLQAYFDRWQIEPLHRDLKTGLGIAQPQVWNDRAVQRTAPAMTASYSLLMLAAHKLYGPERLASYPPLPAWRSKRPRRPSQHDLVTLLRNDFVARLHTNQTQPGVPMPSGWVLPQRQTYAYP